MHVNDKVLQIMHIQVTSVKCDVKVRGVGSWA